MRYERGYQKWWDVYEDRWRYDSDESGDDMGGRNDTIVSFLPPPPPLPAPSPPVVPYPVVVTTGIPTLANPLVLSGSCQFMNQYSFIDYRQLVQVIFNTWTPVGYNIRIGNPNILATYQDLYLLSAVPVSGASLGLDFSGLPLGKTLRMTIIDPFDSDAVLATKDFTQASGIDSISFSKPTYQYGQYLTVRVFPDVVANTKYKADIFFDTCTYGSLRHQYQVVNPDPYLNTALTPDDRMIYNTDYVLTVPVTPFDGTVLRPCIMVTGRPSILCSDGSYRNLYGTNVGQSIYVSVHTCAADEFTLSGSSAIVRLKNQVNATNAPGLHGLLVANSEVPHPPAPIPPANPNGSYMVSSTGILPLHDNKPAGPTTSQVSVSSGLGALPVIIKLGNRNDAVDGGKASFSIPFLCNEVSRARSTNYVKLVVSAYGPPPPTQLITRDSTGYVDYYPYTWIPSTGTVTLTISHNTFQNNVKANTINGVYLINIQMWIFQPQTYWSYLQVHSVETFLPENTVLSHVRSDACDWSLGTAPVWQGVSGALQSNALGLNNTLLKVRVPSMLPLFKFNPVPVFTGKFQFLKPSNNSIVINVDSNELTPLHSSLCTTTTVYESGIDLLYTGTVDASLTGFIRYIYS